MRLQLKHFCVKNTLIRANIRHRVYIGAVHPNLKMQMVPGGVTGAANGGNAFARGYLITLRNG